MNIADKLLSRIETLAVLLSEKSKETDSLKEDLTYANQATDRAHDMLADSRERVYSLENRLRESDAGALLNLKNDLSFFKEQNFNLLKRAEDAERQLRALKFKEYEGKSRMEVAKIIIALDPAPKDNPSARKIPHIRAVRDVFADGLKESKDLIEEAYIELGTHYRNTATGYVEPKVENYIGKSA